MIRDKIAECPHRKPSRPRKRAYAVVLGKAVGFRFLIAMNGILRPNRIRGHEVNRRDVNLMSAAPAIEVSVHEVA